MKSYDKLLLENKAWAAEKIQNDSEYFTKLSGIQTPDFLWIGCSDSRVPANEITGTSPGEIFVHRNIANMVVHTDVNLLSVLEYAVKFLQVKHVIVCGHYGCGGVKASMSNHNLGIINKWIMHIKDVQRIHAEELQAIGDEGARTNRLVELNVIEQVTNLAKTSVIQKAWKDRQGPHLHGWVYGLDNGLIKPIFELPAGSRIDPLYEYDDL